MIDAKHLCVNSRGIKDIESSTVTAEFGGKFKEEATRKEFLEYIKNNECIDTETILQSGFPPKDYYNILIKDTECN